MLVPDKSIDDRLFHLSFLVDLLLSLEALQLHDGLPFLAKLHLWFDRLPQIFPRLKCLLLHHLVRQLRKLWLQLPDWRRLNLEI